MAVIIFQHLQKTGGTTFKEYAYRQYKPQQVCNLNNLKKGAFWEMSQDQKDSLRFVWGHQALERRVWEHFTVPYKFVTIVRNPVNRILSFYSRAKELPAHFLYETFHAYSLEELIQSDFRKENLTPVLNTGFEEELYNHQSRTLSQGPPLQEYAFITTTEKLSGVRNSLHKCLGWSKGPVGKENSTVSRLHPRDFKKRVIQHFRDANIEDYQLYARVCSMLPYFESLG